MDFIQERESKEHSELIGRLADLRDDLAQLELWDGVRQADTLTKIIDDYHHVVESRFYGKKSSPITYLSAARTVQKNGIQNLADMVSVGHSLKTISRNQRTPSQIKTDKQQQRQTKHSDMYDEQSERLESLRDENNKLFDALTETAVEIANIRSFSKFERTDTLARLLALAQLANRT